MDTFMINYMYNLYHSFNIQPNNVQGLYKMAIKFYPSHYYNLLFLYIFIQFKLMEVVFPFIIQFYYFILPLYHF